MSPKITENPVADALADITAEALEKAATKNGRIEIRAAQDEKEQIQETAQSLGISVAEYLLALHRHAYARLRGRGIF